MVKEVAMAPAFLAGVLSFLSPCVLPLVPGYLSLISGFSLESLRQGAGGRRVLGRAALFVLGFALVFCAMGAGASSIGQALSYYRLPLMRAAGVLIVLFGLHFAGVLRLPALYRERRFHLLRLPGGALGALVLGMAFAFGWTPCIGPLLSTILLYAAGQGTALRGMGLLLVYSAGLGLPFLVTALALERMLPLLQRLKRHFRALELVTGALLVLMGLLIFTGELATLSRYLTFFERLAG